MKVTHHSPVAAAYAQALLELACEAGQESAIGLEMSELGKVLEKEPSLHLFLADWYLL